MRNQNLWKTSIFKGSILLNLISYSNIIGLQISYTAQPEQRSGLYGILEEVSVCPVAFEIYERLKKEYGFKMYE